MSAKITAVLFSERESYYAHCAPCEWDSSSIDAWDRRYPGRLDELVDTHNARFHDPKNPPRFVPGAMYSYAISVGDRIGYAYAELNPDGELALIDDCRELTAGETASARPV
ncbi:MAG: hypothetical protein WAV90_00555 [Gordonia amarae]